MDIRHRIGITPLVKDGMELRCHVVLSHRPGDGFVEAFDGHEWILAIKLVPKESVIFSVCVSSIASMNDNESAVVQRAIFEELCKALGWAEPVEFVPGIPYETEPISLVS